MSSKGYLLIKMARESWQNGHADAAKELEALPEVEYATPVSGLYDLVAAVEAPLTTAVLAHKVSARPWVKYVHVLRVDEPTNHRRPLEERLRRQREIIHARRGELKRFLRPTAATRR